MRCRNKLTTDCKLYQFEHTFRFAPNAPAWIHPCKIYIWKQSERNQILKTKYIIMYNFHKWHAHECNLKNGSEDTKQRYKVAKTAVFNLSFNEPASTCFFNKWASSMSSSHEFNDKFLISEQGMWHSACLKQYSIKTMTKLLFLYLFMCQNKFRGSSNWIYRYSLTSAVLMVYWVFCKALQRFGTLIARTVGY